MFQLQQGAGAEGAAGAEAPPPAPDPGQRETGEVALRAADGGADRRGEETQE